jgi:integrase/recombinase XerD
VRLVLATEAFKLHHVSYPGFPIILDDEMRIIDEAHAFLVQVCIRAGSARSKRSWERYGRDLYDFFGYVLTNGLDWKAPQVPGYTHPAEAYRDWALVECELKRPTINGRLRTIRRFYEWAVRTGILESLPFEAMEVRVNGEANFLEHTSSTVSLKNMALYVLLHALKEVLWTGKRNLRSTWACSQRV